MLINLKCINPDCVYHYQISQKELEYNSRLHRKCLICGSKLVVDNLDELVKFDVYKKAENYIKKYVKEMGWDNTIDLIQRNKGQPTYRIYKEILEKMGFNLKGE
jgi:hypothetical protein